MKIRTKYLENVGVDLFIQFPDISENELTFLSADEVTGQTTLSVDSGKNFSANDYVIVGDLGDKKAEIRKVSSQTDKTLVVDALLYDHTRGTRIQFIPYNQIVVSRSTDGTTYNALSAVDINPKSDETIIHRTTDASTDYYKFRFYNSTTTLYSPYSDVVTGVGYADNSVHSIKKRALDDLGEKVSENLTDEWINSALWEGRRELDEDQRILRWAFRIKTDENLGAIVPGTYTVAIPTDLRDPNTNKNILSIRIGKSKNVLEYCDLYDMNQFYKGVAHTTLDGAVLTTDTTIGLTSSGDFEEDGSIDIAAQDIDEEIDSVSYTANDETTDEISGVTGIRAAGHADGTDVWQGVGFGLPYMYTVNAETRMIEFNIPFSNEFAGENIYSDYYSTMPVYNSDADILDEPEVDMFVSYLKWRIKSKQSGGKLDPKTDPDWLIWEKRKTSLIEKQYLGQEINLIPGYED
jgi:hypothetical protein